MDAAKAEGQAGTKAPDEDLYLIWARGYSRDVAVFWRPEACGYTADINKAGRWTKKEAEKLAGDVTGYGRPLPVPLSLVLGLPTILVVEKQHLVAAVTDPHPGPECHCRECRRLMDEHECREFESDGRCLMCGSDLPKEGGAA